MEELARDDLPTLLMCGLHAAGKTSILKVVLDRLAPHETCGIPSTQATESRLITRNPYVNFTVFDLPGSAVFEDTKENKELIGRRDVVVVFVLDAQEGCAEAVATAKRVMAVARTINPNIMFNILVHKLDEGLFSGERKTDLVGDIQAKLKQDTEGQAWGSTQFHCTSICDLSIFEAFSKIIQQMMPQLPDIRHCLDIFNNSTRCEKSFIFDVVSKTCIASNTSAIDAAAFEVCSESLNVVVDISCIYNSVEGDSAKDSTLIQVGSTSVTRMENGSLLYIRGVDKGGVALLCFFREEDYDRPSLIEYNFEVFQETLPGFHVKKTAGRLPASSSLAS